jgi:hypothetical protein
MISSIARLWIGSPRLLSYFEPISQSASLSRRAALPDRYRGSHRVVVGTDSFNAKDIEYPSAVIDQFNFNAADRDRILKGNAIRLLHL